MLLNLYYVVLDAKILINHIEFFLEEVYRHKKFDKTFHTC